ncbi:YtxH domain-containing protein [Mangrovibacillus cuniculi]|uniref:YtxH domain-containing protein n=1 Tax=Mangrovibacillus cuniculi TaxID=2593652 RepID=A0A7S8CC37_9BACI|nr:YtxH domain-containing protein [Mangrovibacillus cuniculi]QPC47260.1 YtxH domain-containing protein [Mangrovibacillus cuniculi]
MTANQEQRDQEQTSNGFLVGTIIGGVVGAVTALFLAPKPGKELRNDLTEQAKNVKERSELWTEQVKGKSTELAENAKQTSLSLVQKVQQETNDVVGKVKEFRRASVQEELSQLEEEQVTTIPLPTSEEVVAESQEEEPAKEMEYSK